MKKFFKDLKKAAIFGLVMSAICLIIFIFQAKSRIIYSIMSNLFLVGTIIYFISALIKIKLDKKFIKISNIILIITFVVSTFLAFKELFTQGNYSYTFGSSSLIWGGKVLSIFIIITDAIYWLVASIYLINLFSGKTSIYENFMKKAFICTSIVRIVNYILGCILALNYAVLFSNYIYYLVIVIFTISIIPYFYQYKNEKINNYEINEKNNLSVLDILGFLIIVIAIIGFIFWREAIYSPKDIIENNIQVLSKMSEKFDAKYTAKSLTSFEYKLADSLEIFEIQNEAADGVVDCIYKKNHTNGVIFIGWDKR